MGVREMVAVVLVVPEAGALNIYCQMLVCLAVTWPAEKQGRRSDPRIQVSTVWSFPLSQWGLEFGVWGLGFGVWGLGFGLGYI